MTFLQPHKKISFELANVIIAGLVILMVGAIFALVAGYNTTVNTSQNIAAMKSQLDKIGAQTTALQNQIIGMTSDEVMQNIANAEGMVEDNNPHYMPVTNNAATNNQAITLR